MNQGLLGAPQNPPGGVSGPQLTREDLPTGGEQRGSHREAAVGAIGAVFGLPAAAQQELEIVTPGLAWGDSSDRVLPASLHFCARLPCPLTPRLNISSPGKQAGRDAGITPRHAAELWEASPGEALAPKPSCSGIPTSSPCQLPHFFQFLLVLFLLPPFSVPPEHFSAAVLEIFSSSVQNWFRGFTG